MNGDKKMYTQADFDRFMSSVKGEYEKTLLAQRERIDELKGSLQTAEAQIKKDEKQKNLIFKAITTALKKADDIERVSLIKYNQEIAQLKSFHNKWISYYNRIIEKYPLDDELVETSKMNGKISQIIDKAGDIEAQYEQEKERLMTSLSEEEPQEETIDAVASQDGDDYTDRAPSGFSFAEALHPKEDLKDIMRELGIIMEE